MRKQHNTRERDADRQKDKGGYREIERQRDRQTDSKRERERQTDSKRETDRETDRQTDRQQEREGPFALDDNDVFFSVVMCEQLFQ